MEGVGVRSGIKLKCLAKGVGVVGVGLLLLLWFVPWTGLREVEGLAMLVAPDMMIAVLVGFGALLLIGLGVWRRRRLALLLGVAAVAVASLFGGRAVVQGLDPQSTTRPGAISVVSWNAQGIPPEEIAARLLPVIEEQQVQIVVLPETGDVIAERVSVEFARLGWKNTWFGPEATSVMVAADLDAVAHYKLVPGNPPWAGITVRAASPSVSTPTIIATHVQQPSPGNLDTLAEHLAWVRQGCDTEPFVLAVGDFNSTLNHLPDGQLGRCSDVAAAHGAGAAATWPGWLPGWLGISIDRGMVGPEYSPSVSSFQVLREMDLSGVEGWGSGRATEHWPILLTLAEAD